MHLSHKTIYSRYTSKFTQPNFR